MISNKFINSDEPDIYYIHNITSQLPYIPDNGKDKNKNIYPNIKMAGQMKLLLNEIRLLSGDIEIHKFKQEQLLILYIGSGKGYHIPTLIQLYQHYNNINWHFYDPNGHCKKLYDLAAKKKNISIFDEYFTNETLNLYKNITQKLIFISDIRSVDDNKTEPQTKNLLFDYDLQNNILKKLNPMFSLIKFRMPFPDDWNNTLCFLKPVGQEYIQAFSKSSSTEFRIFLNSTFIFETITSVDQLKEYEEKLFWYNHCYRYKYDNDLVIANYILNLYNKAEKQILSKIDIKTFLEKLSNNF